MEIKKCKIQFALFRQQCFLSFDGRKTLCSEEIWKIIKYQRAYGTGSRWKKVWRKLDAMVNRTQSKTAPDRGRTGKVPSGISGQAGNTGKLSMVTVLVVMSYDRSVARTCR